MSQGNLYIAPTVDNIPIVESYLITIFDGTGSMSGEYEIAVNAYNEVFQTISRREEYQMAYDQVKNLLPFQSAGSGSITKAFEHVFERLLSNTCYYGKNITILFMSDGKEEFTCSKLENLLKQMNEEFRVQFLCFSIGSDFYTPDMSQLWGMLHNTGQKHPYPFNIERPSINLNTQFISKFQDIRDNFLKFPVSKLKTNQPVLPTATSKPSSEIEIEAVFLCYSESVIVNGQVIKPINNELIYQKFLAKSIQKVFLDGGKQDDFQKVEKVFNNLNRNNEYLQNKKIFDNIQIVKEGAKGNLKFTELSPEDQKQVICDVENFNVRLIQKFKIVIESERIEIKPSFLTKLMQIFSLCTCENK
ncbi:unnamed protein product [Paramecium octaurelia]|uniref:VWFA domain-containing protein n=1 Tax=Paramecium octaurelia TaxID=43137 RepID=A0A8S1XWA5_PAROT|nr:unnamed protein product [Paramecium octaurelia]